MFAAVEGNPVVSYNDLLSVINAIGRPVTITFGRHRRSTRADLAEEELAARSAAAKSRQQKAQPLTEEVKVGVWVLSGCNSG